jgi:predicted permease
MANLLDIISAISPPLFILLIVGLCRRGGWLRVEADASLSVLTVRVLYPCFFFYHLVGHQDTLSFTHFFVVTSAGFICICLGFGCSYFVAKLMGVKSTAISSFTFCSGIFNYGFFAFPVAASIFGEEIIAKIILFNLGVETAIWTAGIWVLASNQFKFIRLLNPPIISIILAVSVREIGGQQMIPSFLWEIITLLGSCAIPIGLLLIGGNFSDLIKNFKLSTGLRVEFSAILVRLLIFPLLIFCYALKGPIPTGMEWFRDILIVQSAMPAGIFAIVIVKNYSGDTTTAMRAILATMVGCLFTTPIWLYLGLKFMK